MSSGESQRRPSLQSVINDAVQAGIRDVYVMIPAQVTRYDGTQTVDCKILIQNVTRGEDDERQVASVPVITNVPVEFMGSGGYRMTFPITDGTAVIDGSTPPATLGSLIFSHRSLDKWLTGSGSEVDPQFDHDHAITDCKFVPGLRPKGSPWSSIPTDHATMGADGGQQMHFHSSTIVAGDEGSAQFVALANKVLTELQNIQSAFSGHTHAAGTLTAPNGAVTGATAAGNSYSPNSVAGSVLKAKQ